MAEPCQGPLATRPEDLRRKLGELAAVARRSGVDTIVLEEPANLTWLLECRVHVPQTLDAACLAAVVLLDAEEGRVRIVTNAIEAPRLRDTELACLDVDWEVLPWWTGRAGALPAGSAVGSDRPRLGTVDLTSAMVAVRRRMTRRQHALLAGVCADAAAAATDVAAGLEPSMTEFAAAGRLAGALLARGLDPIVLMVGGGGRPQRHRHPLPTADLLGDRATLVCCARRHGLVASCTRIVSFSRLDHAARARYDGLLEVERTFLDASRPGARLGDAFASGAAAYPEHGFDADEWHRHHQGGLTGFQPREFPADSTSDVILRPGMAVAWNPSAAGWKVEDTCMVTTAGVQPLVHDDGWPTLTVGGRPRPDVWTR